MLYCHFSVHPIQIINLNKNQGLDKKCNLYNYCMCIVHVKAKQYYKLWVVSLSEKGPC